MDNTQSVYPAKPNTDLLNKAAELAFSDFLKQVTKPGSKGFISEVNNQKIFSFETYLRESGRPEDSIHTFCNHVKSIENNEKTRLVRLTDFRTWAKSLLIAMIPGTLLYLLVTAFLWTFEISFLKLVTFILFALSCPVLFVLLFFLQYLQLKKVERAGLKQRYVIKYFDNDEITFLRTKNKLFIEEKGQ